MGKAIGIDLGTTNSVMAILDKGRPRTIDNLESRPLTPSVVGLTPHGEFVVGTLAKSQAVLDPENTIFSIKRFMGRSFQDEDVQRDIRMVPYNVREAENGEVEVRLGGKYYSPAQVSSFILKSMKEEAEEQIGDVTHAVITVPAYFGQRQKHATRLAGQLAGFRVMHVLPEPTAASLAYGFNLQATDPKHLLVYDLGGGTFDVTVLFVSGGVFEDLAKTGDNHLGGDDFDQMIIDRLIQQTKVQRGIDLRTNREALQKLKEAAERAKINLSKLRRVPITIPAIARDGHRFIDIQQELSREEYEAMILASVKRTIELAHQAIREANLTVDEIDHILLVGGSSKTPLVVESLRAEFGNKRVSRDVDVMECVAHGAAFQTGIPVSWLCPKCRTLNEGEEERCQKCGAMQEEEEERPEQQCPNPSCRARNPVGAGKCRVCGESLRPSWDVNGGIAIGQRTPKPLGVQTVGDKMEVVVEKNTLFPTHEPIPRHFKTSRANQDYLRIPVYEGFEPVASENEYLGEAGGPLPGGLEDGADVTVSFAIDPDGILYVEAFVTDKPEPRIEAKMDWMKRKGDAPEGPPSPPLPGLELTWQDKAQAMLGMLAMTIEQGRPYLDQRMINRLQAVGSALQEALMLGNEALAQPRINEAEHVLQETGFVQVLVMAEAMSNADIVPPDQRMQLASALQRARQAHSAGNLFQFQSAVEALARLMNEIMESINLPRGELENLLRASSTR